MKHSIAVTDFAKLGYCELVAAGEVSVKYDPLRTRAGHLEHSQFERRMTNALNSPILFSMANQNTPQSKMSRSDILRILAVAALVTLGYWAITYLATQL